MYIRDGRAYVVNSDYFVYWQYDPEADPHGFHGSQVLIADVRPTSCGTPIWCRTGSYSSEARRSRRPGGGSS